MVAAICDKDLAWRKKAVEIIRDYAKKTFLDLGTFSFLGKEELFAYTGAPIDVIFLDIELKDTGIEVAEEINRKWKNCQIVYLTNHLYYATEIYATEHVLFVTKNDFENKISEIFAKIIYNIHQKRDKLIFRVIKGTEVILSSSDIMYFERVKRVTVIETVWGKYQIWDKLDDVVPKLSAIDFVRCHNSFIIYFPAVHEMQKSRIILKNGHAINISRSRSKEVHEAFIRWARTQMS